jgi:CheY-like chemotaxis protein
MLERLGARVDVVRNGSEAVDAVARTAYDLVLMDVQMPEMDGFEATHRIRKRETETGGHVPIVALTAHAAAGDRERCLAAGMDEHLSKPVCATDLERVLDRWRPAVASVLDVAVLRDACADDAALARGLLDQLVRVGAEALGAIRAALAESDASCLVTTAHGMKGASVQLGARAFAAAWRDLETLAAQGDLAAAAETAARAEEELGRLRGAVAAYAAGPGPRPAAVPGP